MKTSDRFNEEPAAFLLGRPVLVILGAGFQALGRK